jgi:hypothetical protein
VREQRLGLRFAVAGIEDDELDRGPCRAKRLRDRRGRDNLGTTIGSLFSGALGLIHFVALS